MEDNEKDIREDSIDENGDGKMVKRKKLKSTDNIFAIFLAFIAGAVFFLGMLYTLAYYSSEYNNTSELLGAIGIVIFGIVLLISSIIYFVKKL